MSFEAMTWAVKQNTGDPASKMVLLLLANYAGDDFSCWPSHKTLADGAGCSLRSVVRYIEVLEQLQLITRSERRRRDGTKTTDLICLNVPEADKPAVQDANLALSPKKAKQSANLSDPDANLSKPKCQIGTYIKDEPVIEPITEPSCMDGADFEDLLAAYVPFAPNDNRPSAIAIWKTLTADEQAEAVSRAKAFCASIKGEPPYLVTYLRERRWVAALPASTKPVAVEWVEEGSPRWHELIAAGKRESFMRAQLVNRDGKQCFPHYAAKTEKAA